MKKTPLLLSAMLLMALSSIAQKPIFQDFVEKHRNQPGFSHAYLTKDLFENTIHSGDIDNSDWKKAQSIVKNLGSLIVLAGDSIDNAPAVFKEANQLIQRKDMDELLSVRDGKDQVKICATTDDNHITDLVLLVGAEKEFVLVCFSGDIDLSNWPALASLFNAEEATAFAETAERLTAEISISPNPGSGQFMISMRDTADTPSQLSVTDQGGTVVRTLQLDNRQQQQINLTDLPAGTYWFQVKTEQGKIGVKQVQLIRK